MERQLKDIVFGEQTHLNVHVSLLGSRVKCLNVDSSGNTQQFNLNHERFAKQNPSIVVTTHKSCLSYNYFLCKKLKLIFKTS